MASEAPSISRIRCIGEVVETSRNNERCFVKIALREICVEIPSADCASIHLGDTVAYETSIETRSCTQFLSTGQLIHRKEKS